MAKSKTKTQIPTRSGRGRPNSITAPEGGQESEALPDRPCWWSITINNPTPEECHTWHNLTTRRWVLEFGGQLEIAPTTGTEHIQGWMHTLSVRFSQVKSVFPRANIQAARSPAKLQNYCKKEGGLPIPPGQPPVDLERLFNEGLLVNSFYRCWSDSQRQILIHRSVMLQDGKIEWQHRYSSGVPLVIDGKVEDDPDDWIKANKEYLIHYANDIIQSVCRELVEKGHRAETFLTDTPAHRARQKLFPSILIRLNKTYGKIIDGNN